MTGSIPKKCRVPGLRKYLAIFRISLQNAVQYRANLISSMLFYTLFLFVFFSLWSAIYRGGEVPGLTFPQMIWYLCFTELITMGGARGTFQQMAGEIKNGAIAYQLGRPYHFIGYQFFQSLGTTVLNISLFTVLALATGFAYVGPIPGFTLAMLPPVLLSFVLGRALHFFLYMALGMTAFWLEENGAVYMVFSKLVFMMGTFIPVEFLPAWLQTIARNLPFSYITWAPARLAVGFSWPLALDLLPRQCMWTLAMFALSLLLYRLGVRDLEANGG